MGAKIRVLRNPDGSLILQNQDALDSSDLAMNLKVGFYAYYAAILIATDPRADSLMPGTLPGQQVPIFKLKHKDGVERTTSNFDFYLKQARSNHFILDNIDKSWAAGALLTLGDNLAKHNYFDRCPELELVRHLRNGVAHGNKFNITNPSQLTMHPAHTKNWFNGINAALASEVTPSVNGQTVLFDFITLADLASFFGIVETILKNIAFGLPHTYPPFHV